MAKKYRPYFTLPELKVLHGALANSSNLSNISLINYLSRTIKDIEDGFRKESLTLKPDLLTSLSAEPDKPSDPSTSTAVSLLTRYRESYFSGMTPAEISQVNQLRYENGLMTKDQESEYEVSLFRN